MAGLRNTFVVIALLALIIALALFSQGFTNYAYFVLVIVPIAAIGAIVSMPSRAKAGKEIRGDGAPTGGRSMSSG
jgi:hypothetical protein